MLAPMSRIKRAAGALAVAGFGLLASCGEPAELTAERASRIIGTWAFEKEPVYAEVPQKVWWNAAAPQDDYDRLAVRTLRNLERAGLVTVNASLDANGGTVTATVTKAGFPILGTAPSARGPVFRGRICEKKYDGIRDFERHPTQPRVGHARLVWHYRNPTPLYELFETRIDTALGREYFSLVSFWYEKHQWRFEVVVRKTSSPHDKRGEAGGPEQAPRSSPRPGPAPIIGLFGY